MKKRLTTMQKYWAIAALCAESPYPMTGNEIAKSIGFARSKSITKEMRTLIDEGHFEMTKGKVFGHETTYYFMIPPSRRFMLQTLGKVPPDEPKS